VENSIEEDIKILENFINWLKTDFEYNSGEEIKAIEHILSDYKRILKENEELNKNYNSLIDKIILKIDEYDYKFEKAKRQNKNDIADYYWDLIGNFKKLLGGE
jgi:hypothetical protein